MPFAFDSRTFSFCFVGLHSPARTANAVRCWDGPIFFWKSHQPWPANTVPPSFQCETFWPAILARTANAVRAYFQCETSRPVLLVRSANADRARFECETFSLVSPPRTANAARLAVGPSNLLEIHPARTANAVRHPAWTAKLLSVFTPTNGKCRSPRVWETATNGECRSRAIFQIQRLKLNLKIKRTSLPSSSSCPTHRRRRSSPLPPPVHRRNLVFGPKFSYLWIPLVPTASYLKNGKPSPPISLVTSIFRFGEMYGMHVVFRDFRSSLMMPRVHPCDHIEFYGPWAIFAKLSESKLCLYRLVAIIFHILSVI